MGPTFPELVRKQEQICSIIAEEEEAFSALLDRGIKFLNAVVADAQAAGHKEVSGEMAFYLYVSSSRGLSLYLHLCLPPSFQSPVHSSLSYVLTNPLFAPHPSQV
jgi:alanyl-tRNA synthetase